MHKVVCGIVVVLAILHWDFWFWEDTTLVLGFVPIGLAYHALFSICCALVWASAIKFCWPSHIEEWAGEKEPAGGERG